jgi:hypothetical protein
MTTGVGMRIAGLADDVLRGEAPIAVGSFVERVHPNVPRLLEGATEPATQFALHLDGGLLPAADAREAGAMVTRLANGRAFDWSSLERGVPDDRFPIAAALQASDGQWYVANLRASIHGQAVANQRLAFYGINNGEPVLTRTVPELRFAGWDGAGFPFRHGVDEVAIRRPNFSPEGFLGDGYQPTIVDAHVAKARDAMVELRRLTDGIEPKHTLRHPLGRVEGADLGKIPTHTATIHNELVAAHSDLQRLLPDEQGLTPLDPALRDAVQSLAADVERARAGASDVPYFQLRETVDVDALRTSIDELERRVGTLGAAPQLARGGDAAAAMQLPEFEALLARLQSGSFLTRGEAMRVFPYAKFGRTPAERMRNAGIAMEALEARVGFGDRGVHRLKAWLRDLAVDAATARRELAPDQRDLDTMLAQVEEYAARNGKDGVVINAQGVMGYEDFPDFAEIGRMGAALRTYIAIDDAGRAVQATAEAPTAELLRW